jgi:23S rRNA-/tRNA-specific pseudouridylate synthase
LLDHNLATHTYFAKARGAAYSLSSTTSTNLRRHGGRSAAPPAATAERSGAGPATAPSPQIRLLLSTPHIVAVSKPPGLAFHTDADGNLGLVARLRQQLQDGRLQPEPHPAVGSAALPPPTPRWRLLPPGEGSSRSSSGGGDAGQEEVPSRLWPVHRLDAMTSG